MLKIVTMSLSMVEGRRYRCRWLSATIYVVIHGTSVRTHAFHLGCVRGCAQSPRSHGMFLQEGVRRIFLPQPRGERNTVMAMNVDDAMGWSLGHFTATALASLQVITLSTACSSPTIRYTITVVG